MRHPRKTAVANMHFVPFFIFFEILKLELSPARELDFSCLQNCNGRMCWVPKILEIAVLPAWQPCFEDVHALTAKNWFSCEFAKNLVFRMVFVLQSKTACSHETTSKNCSREPTLFCWLVSFKISKIDLSPARELQFSCLLTCSGHTCWVTKILELAVLPACQPSFEDVRAFITKDS